MQARDAAGRQVSLLNDDNVTVCDKLQRHHQYPPLRFQPPSHALVHPYPSPRSNSSSPNTPELLRSDSCDSHSSNDPRSPLTPSADYACPPGSLYLPLDPPPAKRPPYVDGRSTSSPFNDDGTATPAMPEQRPGKRYPCRYRDSHGCDKTFTTSGHASRHSKIHTAEKAVQCTYPGCQKKFTRADNMKQHLETHYKDKSRPSAGARAHKAALAEARRASSAASRSRSTTATTSASTANRDTPHWESEQQRQRQQRQQRYPMPTPPLPSPINGAAPWDMRSGTHLPLPRRQGASRPPNSGLDALAMAVACQEGGS